MTVKADERAFWEAVKARGAWGYLPRTVDIAASLGIPYKRAQYLVFKWSDRGWYDYGVSWRGGFVTPEGIGVTLG